MTILANVLCLPQQSVSLTVVPIFTRLASLSASKESPAFTSSSSPRTVGYRCFQACTALGMF